MHDSRGGLRFPLGTEHLPVRTATLTTDSRFWRPLVQRSFLIFLRGSDRHVTATVLLSHGLDTAGECR